MYKNNRKLVLLTNEAKHEFDVEFKDLLCNKYEKLLANSEQVLNLAMIRHRKELQIFFLSSFIEEMTNINILKDTYVNLQSAKVENLGFMLRLSFVKHDNFINSIKLEHNNLLYSSIRFNSGLLFKNWQSSYSINKLYVPEYNFDDDNKLYIYFTMSQKDRAKLDYEKCLDIGDGCY